MFKYIADTYKSLFQAGIYDIISFFSPSKFQLCWKSASLDVNKNGRAKLLKAPNTQNLSSGSIP